MRVYGYKALIRSQVDGCNSALRICMYYGLSSSFLDSFSLSSLRMDEIRIGVRREVEEDAQGVNAQVSIYLMWRTW